MKKIFVFLVVFLFFVLPVFSQFEEIEKDQVNLDSIIDTSSYSETSITGEHIRLFNADIRINKDATIDIKETIVYDFFDLEKHGIYRKIPMIKTNQDGQKYLLDYSQISVVDDKNLAYKYSKSTVNNYLELKIGDPDKTITGVRTYVINYKVKGAITYFSDNDELYWNITGNEWQVPIEKVKVQIFLPGKIDEKNLKTDCFTGIFGSKEKNCNFRIISSLNNNGTEIEIFSNNILYPSQGLTTVLGFPINLVSYIEPKKYVPFEESLVGRLFFLLLGLVGLIWYFVLPFYIIYRWIKYGRDPSPVGPGEVQAWYDPPKTPDNRRFLTPAEVGTLGDETVDLKDISSTIVDLARRGYLKIEERKKADFYLIRLDSRIRGNDKLLDYEKLLLDSFFKSKKEIRLRDEYLYEEVEKVKNKLYEDVVEIGLFPKNPQKIRTGYYILALIALFTANFFLAIVAFIFGRVMPRKTFEGVNAFNVAKSLKNFLTSQKRQLEFQADRQMMFEKLLPYAVAFGVERIWAKRFENMNLKQLDWYQSYSSGHFNSVVLANSLSSSMASFRASATPNRSTSGFSSGFGGGGFSGGGGGGGGGGSW
ncbi:MAG: DUF2207 domain-containing protein [Patescibacteria group bacterium]|nr:DUF2207 domain-containing protein [Patescibacteria group bacterium]